MSTILDLAPDHGNGDLAAIVGGLCKRLRAAAAACDLGERQIAAISAACLSAGIPCTPEDASRASGLGAWRAERRSAGLALAVLSHLYTVAYPRSILAPMDDIVAAAVATLQAYRLGTGGGWVDPGAGTCRCVPLVDLVGEGDSPCIADYLRDLAVPYGGGLVRQYATGGSAWSASADHASQILHTLRTTDRTIAVLYGRWGYADAQREHDLAQYTGLPSRLWEQSLEVYRRRAILAAASGASGAIGEVWRD